MKLLLTECRGEATYLQSAGVKLRTYRVQGYVLTECRGEATYLQSAGVKLHTYRVQG